MFTGRAVIHRTSTDGTVLLFAAGCVVVCGVILASFLLPSPSPEQLVWISTIAGPGKYVCAFGYFYLIRLSLRPKVQAADVGVDAGGVTVGGTRYLARGDIFQGYLRGPIALGAPAGAPPAAPFVAELLTKRGMIRIAPPDPAHSAQIVWELGFPQLTLAANQPAPRVPVGTPGARTPSWQTLVAYASVGLLVLTSIGAMALSLSRGAARAASEPGVAPSATAPPHVAPPAYTAPAGHPPPPAHVPPHGAVAPAKHP